MRNFAIPKGERSSKNPLASSAEVIEQGRAYYLHRRTICHGEEQPPTERLM
jgi:hypothetical protein